jgi:phosphatidylinositol 4-kinase type 2
MPRPAGRPPASGYERLAQQEDLSDSDDDDSLLDRPDHSHSTSIHSIARSPSPPRHRSSGAALKRTKSSNSGVDIKAINARLELWADQIAAKFKSKGRSRQERAPLEIAYSVFSAPEGYRAPYDGTSLESPVTAEGAQFTNEQFQEVVEAVRLAISKGIDPKLITQGSSGTYFMRDSNGDVVGIMKPKDEESYATWNSSSK